MKQVAGMAKRCLDLKGAKGPKVELDYLRLVYTLQEVRRSGHLAPGYLLVMTPAIARKVKCWHAKYQAGDSVVVAIAELSSDQSAAVDAEVRANIEGMVGGTLGDDVAGRSTATVGSQTAEQQRGDFIERQEAGVVRCVDVGKFPFQIRWHFFETAPTQKHR